MAILNSRKEIYCINSLIILKREKSFTTVGLSLFEYPISAYIPSLEKQGAKPERSRATTARDDRSFLVMWRCLSLKEESIKSSPSRKDKQFTLFQSSTFSFFNSSPSAESHSIGQKGIGITENLYLALNVWEGLYFPEDHLIHSQIK